MQNAITAIFCTLCMAAGWYYLARSQGVARLALLESPRRNATRRRARRMGAWSMMMIGAAGFWLMFEVDRTDTPSRVRSLRVVVAAFAVMIALLTMVLSAMVDMYLTMRMRRSNRGQK